ncbi:MAG TPA: hypothetical protein PK402_09650, partial [Tepidisphaeraceae bacterium]|nr:hypothetical protein [Tepidisphaeraceae bacterium]
TSELQAGPSARTALTVVKWSADLETSDDLDMDRATKEVKKLDDATVESELKSYYAKTRRERLQGSVAQSMIDAKLKELGKSADDIDEDTYESMYEEFDAKAAAEVEKLDQAEIDKRALALDKRNEIIATAAENEADFYFLSRNEEIDDGKHNELNAAAKVRLAALSDLELNEYNQRADLVNTAVLMSKFEELAPLASVFSVKMIKAMVIWLCASVGIAFSLPYKAGFRE